MIAHLRGVVLERNLDDAVIDVNGVGYRVRLSLLSLSRLPEEGQPAKVRIQTVVREDAFDLFGFLTRAEEEMFLLLTSVSHVGPKVAMSVLSGLEVPDLATAISKGEVGRLTKIRGVGKKTAERLVLELKDKVKVLVIEAARGEARPGRRRARSPRRPRLRAREPRLQAAPGREGRRRRRREGRRGRRVRGPLPRGAQGAAERVARSFAPAGSIAGPSG